MGIKGLNPFLKKKCPDCFVDIPCTHFKGKRIAIDSENVLRKFMCRAHKEVVYETDVVMNELDRDVIVSKWLEYVKMFVFELLEYSITPIFVFDGDYMIEKKFTQEKRRKDRKKAFSDAQELKDKIMELDELERTTVMINNLRSKMANLGYISSDDKDLMIHVLNGIGIPVLTAKNEGEKLCAMLCIEGRVDAVYSKDTDVVALGSPLTISDSSGYVIDPKTNNAVKGFKCCVFKPILSKLNLEYGSFLDLCIMAGCDFNTNIPHLGIGKSYNILKKCKSIDNIPASYHVKAKCERHERCKMVKDNYDDQVNCLNHDKCRNIFKIVSSKEECQDQLILNVDTSLENARDILELYDLQHWLIQLPTLYANLKTPENVIIHRYPSLNRSKLKIKIINNDNNNDNNNDDNDNNNDNTENLIYAKPKINNDRKYIENLNKKRLDKLRKKKLL